VTRSVGIHLVSVFPDGPGGGNPAPVVIDAAGLSDRDMQAIAAHFGHESVFVRPAQSGCDLDLRFFVPRHEMEMCGHATVGAVWLLDRLGKLSKNRLVIGTRSGRIEARIADAGTQNARVEISQPRGEVMPLPRRDAADQILSVLGIGPQDLAPFPVCNARTSRTKTLIPLTSVECLDRLTPDFTRIEAVCAAIDSTGLYPFAVSNSQTCTFDARQFPRSSGYPEDAATGIAAAALAFGLLEAGRVAAEDRPIRVRQGRAMGRPSEITVRLQAASGGVVPGCWLGGAVRFEAKSEFAFSGG
jgi:PhzF family phenazine biosynthesis protein